jgi:hypothetical protein
MPTLEHEDNVNVSKIGEDIFAVRNMARQSEKVPPILRAAAWVCPTPQIVIQSTVPHEM